MRRVAELAGVVILRLLEITVGQRQVRIICFRDRRLVEVHHSSSKGASSSTLICALTKRPSKTLTPTCSTSISFANSSISSTHNPIH